MSCKSYKKEKIFRSKIKMYKVEVEILEEYSMFDSLLVIRIYDKAKYHKFYEKTVKIKNNFSNSDLDAQAINCIEEYEDWKIVK